MSRFFEAFIERVAANPRSSAIVDPHAQVASYLELFDRARLHATYLQSKIASGSIVPIFAGKSADSIALSLGCLATGRPFAWINLRLRGPQLETVLAAADASICVVDAAALIGLSKTIQASNKLRNIQWLVLPQRPSWASSVIAELTDDDIDVREIDLPAKPRESLPGTDANDLASCLFTSGSTGTQKGVMISEADLFSRSTAEAQWYGLSSRDRLLSVLPFSFDVGLNQLLSGLLVGACIVLQDSWLPKDIITRTRDESITGISSVPAIWRDFLGLPNEEMQGLLTGGCLRYVTISGGSLSRSEQQDMVERFGGVEIFKTYGQTETFRSASACHADVTEYPESVGRPWGGAEVLIVNSDTERCGPGKVGEIIHIGPGTMMGYVGETPDRDKLRRLPESLGGQLAVFTGDYGYLDDDGYLYLKGRKDDMIKVAGNRVYLDEVAAQLRALPGVREAEVVTLSQDQGEPQIVAFLTGTSTGNSEAELRKDAGKQMPAYMMPTRFFPVSGIPRLPNGKPDRQSLLKRASDEG